MGVYVKGMKMPENCCGCLLKEENTFLQGMGNIVHCGWVCGIIHEPISEQVFYSSRLSECPLTEILEPHGRLIDENELTVSINNIVNKIMIFGGEICYTQSDINNASTVIEAEGE